MGMNVGALLFWLAGWAGYLALPAYPPAWVPWVLAPYLLYSFYRVYMLLRFNFPWGMRMRRILGEYPWHVRGDVPRGLLRHPGARDDGAWVEIPHPTVPDGVIPVVFIAHHRTYWWTRRIGGPRTKPELKAQLEPLWFAGDPRFIVVIAASGRGGAAPKRLHLLFQRPPAPGRGGFPGSTRRTVVPTRP